jgi:hypothetical protein
VNLNIIIKTMMYSLKKEQLISLYLSRVIPISEIRYLIINRKNKIETEETLDYHMERWTNIAGSHYTTHDTHFGKFSIIHDSINYVVKPDHRLDFYNATGVSYQIVELIHGLIKRNFILPGVSHRPCHYKKFMKEDDKLYSQLANLIMKEMK